VSFDGHGLRESISMSDGHQHHHHHHGHEGQGTTAADDGRALDPVCGVKLDPKTTPHQVEHEGRECSFCSAGCKTKFEADPARYLEPKDIRPAAPAPAGAIYTCPMHPQIR